MQSSHFTATSLPRPPQVILTPHSAFATKEALGNIADTTVGCRGSRWVWLCALLLLVEDALSDHTAVGQGLWRCLPPASSCTWLLQPQCHMHIHTYIRTFLRRWTTCAPAPPASRWQTRSSPRREAGDQAEPQGAD